MDPSPGITLATLFADFGMILFALILVLLNKGWQVGLEGRRKSANVVAGVTLA